MSIERRIKKLENRLNRNKKKQRVALVVYDPAICHESDLPPIEASIILCLPDNGFRLRDKSMPPEGYLIQYS